MDEARQVEEVPTDLKALDLEMDNLLERFGELAGKYHVGIAVSVGVSALIDGSPAGSQWSTVAIAKQHADPTAALMYSVDRLILGVDDIKDKLSQVIGTIQTDLERRKGNAN